MRETKIIEPAAPAREIRVKDWNGEINFLSCELVSEEAAAPSLNEALKGVLARGKPADPIDPNARMIASDGPAKPKQSPPPKVEAPRALPANPGLLASWADASKRWLV